MADTLNDMTIRKLAPKEKEYTQREKGGFGVRVLPSGRKVFFYMYRVDGRRRFLNLGTYKDKDHPDGITLAKAREDYEAERAKVKALKAGRAEGVDPVEQKKVAKGRREAQRDACTVADLCREYIERHAKKFKRSWETDERILNREVVPAWGNRKAAEIVKRDVVLLLEKIVDRGSPIMANNTFAVIRKMFNFAIERDILPHTPCYGVKPPAPKVARERVLSEAEIKTFWNTLDGCAMSEEVRHALRLILATAQRPGEVVGMHTRELELASGWWTIPAERAKNGKTHRVYLSAVARGLVTDAIEKAKEDRGLQIDGDYSGFIFPTPSKKKEQAIAPQALIVAVNRALAPAEPEGKGKVAVASARLCIDHFTPHDLRRTAATFMAQAGEMDEVIDSVLNHAKQGVIKVYNQFKYDAQKQAALETWGRKLTSIITGEAGGKIIPIERAKAI